MDKKIYKDKLINIFRDDVFYELMEFWKKMEESKYDYKIFVSKKCYVLYKVCMPLLDFNSYNDCIKITDTAIPFYIDKMKDSKVLVIDDVFIHGRAASKIDEELGGKVKKVDFYTFAKNNNHEEPQDTSTIKIRKRQNDEQGCCNWFAT